MRELQPHEVDQVSGAGEHGMNASLVREIIGLQRLGLIRATIGFNSTDFLTRSTNALNRFIQEPLQWEVDPLRQTVDRHQQFWR